MGAVLSPHETQVAIAKSEFCSGIDANGRIQLCVRDNSPFENGRVEGS
jgi:hypothetical protein